MDFCFQPYQNVSSVNSSVEDEDDEEIESSSDGVASGNISMHALISSPGEVPNGAAVKVVERDENPHTEAYSVDSDSGDAMVCVAGFLSCSSFRRYRKGSEADGLQCLVGHCTSR